MGFKISKTMVLHKKHNPNVAPAMIHLWIFLIHEIW